MMIVIAALFTASAVISLVMFKKVSEVLALAALGRVPHTFLPQAAPVALGGWLFIIKTPPELYYLLM